MGNRLTNVCFVLNLPIPSEDVIRELPMPSDTLAKICQRVATGTLAGDPEPERLQQGTIGHCITPPTEFFTISIFPLLIITRVAITLLAITLVGTGCIYGACEV